MLDFFILTIVALLAYVLQIRLPAIVSDSCYLIGNITTPISMLVIGASLAEVQLLSIFTERRLYAMTALRLVGIPILIYAGLVQLTSLNPELIAIATITFGMPVGSMIVMLAQEFENQVGLAVRSVSLTTLACLLSVPFLIRFLTLSH